VTKAESWRKAYREEAEAVKRLEAKLATAREQNLEDPDFAV
jgi:hypothetical protein